MKVSNVDGLVLMDFSDADRSGTDRRKRDVIRSERGVDSSARVPSEGQGGYRR